MTLGCASRTTIISGYACPSDIAPVPNQLATMQWGYYRCSYRGCAGSGDAHGDAVLDEAAGTPGRYIGVFGFRPDSDPTHPRLLTGATFADISDGTSSTVLLSENLVPGPEASGWGGAWGETFYGNMGGALFSTALTPNSGAPDLVFGWCPHDAGDTRYDAQCTMLSLNQSGTPSVVGAYAAARSAHAGGVNAAMADGSVSFIGNSIDLYIWRSLGTRAGNEPVPADY